MQTHISQVCYSWQKSPVGNAELECMIQRSEARSVFQWDRNYHLIFKVLYILSRSFGEGVFGACSV